MSTGSPTDSPGGPHADGSAPHAEPRPFGHYLLLKELGRGAQGVVYLAEDATLHRKVALKMLTGAGAQSQIVRDRFRREAELTSRFEHPGICGVHDVGEVDGMPYIAMQYVRGTTLASLVEKAKQGSGDGGDASTRSSDTITIMGGGSKGGLEDVVRLVERAARALHVAHEAGLVHRDVKPANIMVTSEGHPVLLDFGLARDLDGEGQVLTQSGQIMGTPAYLAPEQISAARGTVDRRTDVYALGVTLFECLTSQRPFESPTWDALFHEILEGAPRSPRRINPRIPRDLGTVIEVAMDRDQTRRYPTAEALAEDLRRVRSFEPIQAKAAGPITRLAKWSRRDPGRAASVAVGVLVVLSGLGFFATRAFQRAHDLRMQLQTAQEALVAADYVRASVAIAKAQELDPESPEVLELTVRVDRGRAEAQRELERKQALAGAALARDEAEALRVSYAQTQYDIDELSARILKERSGVFARYAPDASHVAFAGREGDLQTRLNEAEGIRFRRSEALERARRLEEPWGGVSDTTLAALAAWDLERWREALTKRDTARVEAMRTAVEGHDPRGEHRAELLGRGTLAVSAVPNDAQVFLFRWEDYETLRPGGVIPRLVPVPTTGVGHAHEGPWSEGFIPGDPCLVVLAVEPDSIAARNGLAPGDLVLQFGAAPAAGSICVRDVAPGSCLARSGIKPLARVLDVDGVAIQSMFDWSTHVSRKDGAAAHVNLAGHDGPLECSPDEIRVASALDLIGDGVAVPVRFVCLHEGDSKTFEVPAGARLGARCEPTAYPLLLTPKNRLTRTEAFEADPGSYLLLVRSTGFESQRFNVVVGRRQTVDAHVELLTAGSVPAGFVYIPPGPFIEGGDVSAFRPREASRVELPGFFLARKELTNREWYAFVNDPQTLAKIAASKPGQHLYLPEDDRVMAKPLEGGAGYVWDVFEGTTAETPVLGLSWTDVHDYLAWRNAQAAEHGEAWRYDLPSESEWEKAARGVDERIFPWGDRFDPSLTVCLVRKDSYLLPVPGGFEPCDESPFGVLDMAGSREEWLRDIVADAQTPRARKRGASWSSAVEVVFRSASRAEATQDRFAANQGVRLLARRP